MLIFVECVGILITENISGYLRAEDWGIYDKKTHSDHGYMLCDINGMFRNRSQVR